MAIIQDSTNEETKKLMLYRIVFRALECALEVFEKQESKPLLAVTSKKSCNLKKFGEQYEKMNYMMKAIIGQSSSAIFEGDNRYNELAVSQYDEKADLENKIQRMKYYLQMQKKEQFLITLDELCLKLSKYKSIHDILPLELYMNIATIILEYIKEKKLNESISFKIGLYKLTNANEHKNWYSASEYLKAVSMVLFELTEDHVSSLSYNAIKRVEMYIIQHISEDLSLSQLASIGGFNSSYLSRLYKQTHSFTRAFKGAVGLSPQEFREMKSL